MFGALAVLFASVQNRGTYPVDGFNVSSRFEGIGGLSAGGTSRLLLDYAPTVREELLDLLFAPDGGGAALHWLKVEIGGDTFAGAGSEPSHMRAASEVPNLRRGYEGWLLAEAAKRAPALRGWGLSWGFPAWVGGDACAAAGVPQTPTACTNDIVMADAAANARMAVYAQQWALGLSRAPHHFNLSLIGVWNEDSWSADYVKVLRRTLDSNDITRAVAISAPDHNLAHAEAFVAAMSADAELAAAVTVPMGSIGVHYPPGSNSSSVLHDATARWGIPIVSSEDSSTNDAAAGEGPGCWARVLNWNYVRGRLTSTTMWSLVSAWYRGLDWFGDGLFSAAQPWSGHFENLEPLFVTAHWTQFTAPGWHYLAHGAGVGWLDGGGSYTTLISGGATATAGNFTVVLETMTQNHSQCIRDNPRIPWSVAPMQTVKLALTRLPLPLDRKLAVWRSVLFNGTTHAPQSAASLLVREDDATIGADGSVSVAIAADSVVTLTTLRTGSKRAVAPAPPAPFPMPYTDSFARGKVDRLPRYFSDQSGSFAFAGDASAGSEATVLEQQVLSSPSLAGVGWHNKDPPGTLSIVGEYASMADCVVSVRARIAGSAAVNVTLAPFVAVAARLGGKLSASGCTVHGPREQGCVEAYSTKWYDFGYFLVVGHDRRWALRAGNVTLAQGALPAVHAGAWQGLKLAAVGDSVTCWVDDHLLANVTDRAYARGWAGIGSGFHLAQFANFSLSNKYEYF